MSRPVLLLAFAYDETNALPEVKKELRQIQSILTNALDATVITRWEITQDQLENDIDQHQNELILFHFSGHADGLGIQLNADGAAAQRSFVGGLAGLLEPCKNLKLVFLNGCSTEEQAARYMDVGIPAVIATTRPLLDVYGIDFATRFYKYLSRPNRSTLSLSFKKAWNSFWASRKGYTDAMLHSAARGAFDTEEAHKTIPLYELKTINDDAFSILDEDIDDWLRLEASAETTESADTQQQPSTSTPSNGAAQHIQDLIANGKLPEALAELSKHSDDATLLLSRLNSLKNQQNMGLLSFSDANMEMNRISYAALEMSKKL